MLWNFQVLKLQHRVLVCIWLESSKCHLWLGLPMETKMANGKKPHETQWWMPLCWTRIWYLAQIDKYMEGITWHVSLGNSWQPNNIKTHVWRSQRRFFLLKSRLFPSLMEETSLSSLKRIIKYECELHLKQLMTSPQCKIIIAYSTPNHRLANEIEWWSTIPISRDNILCHVCSYNVVETRHTLYWSIPYITSLEMSLDISQKLITLCQYRELADLTLYWWTFSPMSLMAF